MEEIISLLVHNGCKLARELELNLPNLVNQPYVISNSCDEIIQIFTNIKKHLIIHHDVDETRVGVQQWLRSSDFVTNVVDRYLVQTRAAVTENSMFDDMHGMSNAVTELRDVETSSARSRGSGDHEIRHSVDAGLSSSQRPTRSRNNNTKDGRRIVIRVPALRNGDTCIPPDDHYTWRKYGQKEILGSTFPRSYYRCTHQKLYHCPAKKLAQRLDHDPHTFEITYRGDHTCILSPTVPSGAPAPPPPTATDSPTRLYMEFRPHTIVDTQIQVYPHFYQSGRAVGSSSVGPSTVRFETHVDYQLPVVDMADVMFNSGTSSDNSMEFIFPSNMEDK